MKSFSSSVINKSGKKFAPKAPVRRAAPAPPRAPSRRPSVASQASASHPPAAASETATPEPLPPAPSTSTVEPPTPPESTVPESSAVAPTVEHPPNDQVATAIPIPRPKRKASIPAPTPRPTKDIVTRPQTSPPPSTTPISDPATQTPDQNAEGIEAVEAGSDVIHGNLKSAPPSAATSDDEIAPEVRPSKRPRTTIETSPTTAPGGPLEEAAQLVTPPATQTPGLVERAESRARSESQNATQPSKSAGKARVRKSSRSASNDAGTTQKKERKRRVRKREPTPEGAELIEIAPAVIKMSDLCKDTRTGKRSKRETELRAHELAEAEQKRAQQEESRPDQTPVKETPTEASPTADQSNKKSQAGPVMRIVNGQIVLDADSLQVDRYADAERNVGELEDVVENSLTRKINQATYGKRSKTESWDEDMTDLFYRGLRMFGTDFMVISKLFPGRSRRQIKLKFNNEERRDPLRIKDTLLGPRESIDINTYSEMTNTVYDDPRVIQQELDEEKRRIEEQHEKDKKAQEDLLRNPDGLDGNNASGPDKGAAKGKRNNKKQTARDLGGGTEEVFGSLDD
ncbi:hypothetical protein BDW59DRAFT_51902 [Aspergillus cavernicola]|uniref:Myb-like domain-containing protein n=1 Tax=Aspergillus cavernicola TaxID=176166 RepID=A0ABR4IKG6_9EURO